MLAEHILKYYHVCGKNSSILVFHGGWTIKDDFFGVMLCLDIWGGFDHSRLHKSVKEVKRDLRQLDV